MAATVRIAIRQALFLSQHLKSGAPSSLVVGLPGHLLQVSQFHAYQLSEGTCARRSESVTVLQADLTSLQIRHLFQLSASQTGHVWRHASSCQSVLCRHVHESLLATSAQHAR